MFARCPFHLRLLLPLIFILTTHIYPYHLLERNIFDLCLPEFDKPWVIHLRETCCCSTNLCTWRPNTAYKNRSVPRHQAIFWRRYRGGECSKVFPLDSAILSFWFLF